jgi:anaerobic selenocysteine-containing dehydrogenase
LGEIGYPQNDSKVDNEPYTITRRKFLLLIPPAVAGFLANIYIPNTILSLQALKPIDTSINPLETYPNRNWEEVYRDVYTPDYTFHYLCAPNCTHGCLLKASVKNGVIRYVDPSFGYNSATDLYGNRGSARWDPRICVSGLSYVRRFYSDRRVKKPMVRVGFRAWVEDGLPRDPETGAPPAKYFEGRGRENWVVVSWDEAFELVAKALLNIVKTYSGVEGAEKLRKQGYDPAMIDAMGGAGTQVVKVRGGASAWCYEAHKGSFFDELKIDPALEGEFEVQLLHGRRVKVRPVFDLVKEYLFNNFDLDTTSEITWAPKEAIINLVHLIAANNGYTLFVTGMGPNHYYHSDLKDRAVFLLAALTSNIGRFGGTVGSYAGNYRIELFNGVTQWIFEDPFNIEEDPSKPAKTKSYFRFESAHYYNYGDRPLRVGSKLFTGRTHLPTPTKAVWQANSNSILGNSKWAYDVIVNTLPKVEMIIVNEWFWTATCEYADIVFAVDSWPERKIPDVYGSCSNPFLQAAPRTPLPRMFDTKDDIECYAGVAAKLADLTGVDGFREYWKFVYEGNIEYYIDRVFKAGNATKGYSFKELEESCRNGVPSFFATRTTPRVVGWEQVNESKPWYTKTGRLEFYRDEDEYIEYGENLPVWREQVDSTFYEPNVIVSKPISFLKPKQPQEYGLELNELSTEVRQVRNVIKPWVDVKSTRHPLVDLGYTHILYTPKYRHACHCRSRKPLGE